MVLLTRQLGPIDVADQLPHCCGGNRWRGDGKGWKRMCMSHPENICKGGGTQIKCLNAHVQ